MAEDLRKTMDPLHVFLAQADGRDRAGSTEELIRLSDIKALAEIVWGEHHPAAGAAREVSASMDEEADTALSRFPDRRMPLATRIKATAMTSPAHPPARYPSRAMP